MDDQATAPAEAAAAIGAAETPDTSMDSTMEAVWDRLNESEPPPSGHNGGPEMEAEPASEAPQRDERGRFASKAAETNAEAPQPDEATPTTAGAPEGWPADAATQWDKLPKPVQEALRADLAAGRIGSTAQQASAQPDPIRDAIKAYEPDIARRGATPEQAITALLEAQRFLDANPTEGLKWLAREYRVDLAQLAPQQPQEGQQPQGWVDPEVAALRNQLAALQAQIAGVTQAEQQRQIAAVQAEVNTWAKDKPHFASVRTEMGKLVQAGYSLDDAYEMACARDPQVRKAIAAATEAKRREEAARHAAQAAKAAAVNIRSAPTGAPAKPRSMEESMAAAYDRLMGAA